MHVLCGTNWHLAHKVCAQSLLNKSGEWVKDLSRRREHGLFELLDIKQKV
jgi:hypothetical protein